MEPAEFTEGEEAFKAGAHIAANPYGWGSEEQGAWARGWRAGQKAKRDQWAKDHPLIEGDGDDIPF